MGLTGRSTGAEAIDNGLIIKKQSESDKIIALAGNPNVGKSTRATGPERRLPMHRAVAVITE